MTTYADLKEYLPKKHPPIVRSWTPAQDAEFAAMLAAGKSLKQCAAELGRGYDSVRHRRYHLEVPYQHAGRWTPERSAQLTELIQTGHSYQEAADIIGCTRAAARNHSINTLGLTNQVRLWVPAELDFLRENWGKLGITHLEKRLGKSRGAIRNKAARMGLV